MSCLENTRESFYAKISLLIMWNLNFDRSFNLSKFWKHEMWFQVDFQQKSRDD